MQLNRELPLMGKPKLVTKGPLLNIGTKLVVGTEVEADLAHTYTARAGKEAIEASECCLVQAVRTVGMRPRHDVHVVEKFRNSPAVEGRRLQALPSCIVKRRMRALNLRVQPCEQIPCSPPPLAKVINDVNGHHKEAQACEGGMSERVCDVKRTKAGQMSVSVRKRCWRYGNFDILALFGAKHETCHRTTPLYLSHQPRCEKINVSEGRSSDCMATRPFVHSALFREVDETKCGFR